jgi:hypothetical protein
MRPNFVNDSKYITPLGADNYYTWTEDIMPILRVNQAADFITKNFVKEIRAMKDVEEWKKLEKLDKDQTALGIIQINCTSTYKSMISKCKTAWEAWNLLNNHFTKQKGLSKHTDLNKEIGEIRFVWKNNGLDEYVKEHREVKKKFEDIGVSNTQEFYLSHFLANLPDEFETVLEILSHDKETTTISAALPKLLEKFNKLYKKRKSDETRSEALVVIGKEEENARDATMRELVESVKLLAAKVEKKEFLNHKRRKIDTCGICGGPANHRASSCWGNPESAFYRPNWKRREITPNTAHTRQDSESQEVSALVGRMVKFGKNKIIP